MTPLVTRCIHPGDADIHAFRLANFISSWSSGSRLANYEGFVMCSRTHYLNKAWGRLAAESETEPFSERPVLSSDSHTDSEDPINPTQ